MQSQRTPSLDGTPPTFATPAASETVPMGSILIVKNGSAAAVTVTFVTPGNLPTGDAYPDRVYTIPAGAERWLPLLEAYRDQATQGVAAVTFSATTSVTAAAVYTD